MHKTPYGSITSLLRENLQEDIASMTYDVYIEYFDTFADRLGMDIDILPNNTRIYSLGDRSQRPSVFIVAGQHGDEKAGSIALLDLIRNEDLPSKGFIRICPVVSPEAWDNNVRKEDGIDLNRSWTHEKANPTILTIMMSIDAHPPDVFIDHHESGTEGYNDVLPKHHTRYELRYSGKELNKGVTSKISHRINFLRISKHIKGSSVLHAVNAGIEKVVCVETNAMLPLEYRVEFHKQIIKHCTVI